MSHEVVQDTLRFFDDWESDLIEAWLGERGLTAWSPTVCGSCCGYYEDEYSVDLSSEQVDEFNALATEKQMDARAENSGIYIGALEVAA